MGKRSTGKDKKVGAYLGLQLNSADLTRGFNLGRYPVRWTFAIGLGIVFLVSVFGSMVFDPTISLGIVFFWMNMWLGWPKNKLNLKQVLYFIILQVFFCAVFIFIAELVGEPIYKKFGYWGFKILFLFLGLAVWLGLNRVTYGWIERMQFQRKS